MKKVLTINCGSTSTKLAVFHDREEYVREELFIDADVTKQFKDAVSQLGMRKGMVLDFLASKDIDPAAFDIIVCRGGPLPPLQGGAYAVNQLMVDVLTYAAYTQHASSLSCMIGRELARPYGIPVIIYDAPGTDEFDNAAKVTGLPEVVIVPVSHVLNTRKVARDTAGRLGKPYEECGFIVAHLGGGISINVHKNGRIVDSVYDDMGPMSPQRAGRIPTRFMTTLCYSGEYTEREMRRRLNSEGGLTAYFGTQDIREVQAMAERGDERAYEVFYAMGYQIAKAIGELAPVLYGKIDAVILTGGGARSKMLTDWITERVEFLAPVVISPGEMEMEALNEGGLRVLEGLDEAKEYDVVPGDCRSAGEFYAKYVEGGQKAEGLLAK